MRALLLFALLAYLGSASAQTPEFYWTTGNAAFPGIQEPSPQLACDKIAQIRLDTAGGTRYENSPSPTSPSGGVKRFRCGNVIYAINETSGGEYRFGSYSDVITLVGECPLGSEYDETTGTCKQDCSETEGQKLAARGPVSPVMTDGDGVRNILPEPFSNACFDGCSYEIQSSFSDRLGCYLQSGSTTEGFCNYRVTGNGESCPASTGVPAGGGDPLNPTPPPDDPDDPPTDPGCPPPYVWNGDFCQSDPGDGDGGDGPGDGDGGDGPGDGGGGGPGDGGGDGGGGDGPGDGDGDGDGSGDGGGDGDGDGSGDGGGGGGDGDGDCTGEECGPGEGGGLSAPEAGTFDDAITEYEQKIADSLEDIKNKSGQFGDLIKQKLNVQLSSGNAILPCFDAVIMGESVGFCFSTYTEQLSILRALLLFLATVIALYIIFREDK